MTHSRKFLSAKVWTFKLRIRPKFAKFAKVSSFKVCYSYVEWMVAGIESGTLQFCRGGFGSEFLLKVGSWNGVSSLRITDNEFLATAVAPPAIRIIKKMHKIICYKMQVYNTLLLC